MQEIMGAPSLIIFNQAVAPSGTAVLTAKTNAILMRSGQANALSNARHLTVLIGEGPKNTDKTFTYVISHAASITDAATNMTDLFTITSTGNNATDRLHRVEMDIVGLQPAIKFTVSANSAGTAETVAISAIAILSDQEQTPIASSMLATGKVLIYAAGATQSN